MMLWVVFGVAGLGAIAPGQERGVREVRQQKQGNAERPSPAKKAQPIAARTTKDLGRSVPAPNDYAAAEDTVKLIINLNGHLCADITDVQPARGSRFEVGCVKYRSGAGRAA